MTRAPVLAGVHHLKLPVSDLRRSQHWYESRLGYCLTEEFHGDGRLAGIGMEHPDGGPAIAFVLDPARAEAAAGFDYFAIGVPDKESIKTLAARLDELGESHAGVHVATLGWILPLLHDPDGHEVRFYTHQHHTDPPPDEVLVVHDAIATARRRAAELGEDRAGL
ncbi:VOC family protein [Nocardioides sediminis]|uniref:VOC family protein n=1 Tax=Nocardioides sediminis TaxID=433648 RepID=UPI000D30BA72|nr:VOC family protein [Nocardioides sediminis]